MLNETTMKERLSKHDYIVVSEGHFRNILVALLAVDQTVIDDLYLVGVRYLLSEKSLSGTFSTVNRGTMVYSPYGDKIEELVAHGGMTADQLSENFSMESLEQGYFDYWGTNIIRLADNVAHRYDADEVKDINLDEEDFNTLLSLYVLDYHGKLCVTYVNSAYTAISVLDANRYRGSKINYASDKVLSYDVKDREDQLYPMLNNVLREQTSQDDDYDTSGVHLLNKSAYSRSGMFLSPDHLRSKNFKHDLLASLSDDYLLGETDRPSLKPRSVDAPLGELTANTSPESDYSELRSVVLGLLMNYIGLFPTKKFKPKVYATARLKGSYEQGSDLSKDNPYEQVALSGGLFQRQLVATKDSHLQVYNEDNVKGKSPYDLATMQVGSSHPLRVQYTDDGKLSVPASQEYYQYVGESVMAGLSDTHSSGVMDTEHTLVTMDDSTNRKEDLILGYVVGNIESKQKFKGYFYLDEDRVDQVDQLANKFLAKLSDPHHTSAQLTLELNDYYYNVFRVPNHMVMVTIVEGYTQDDLKGSLGVIVPMIALTPLTESADLLFEKPKGDLLVVDTLALKVPMEGLKIFADDLDLPLYLSSSNVLYDSRTGELFSQVVMRAGVSDPSNKLKNEEFKDYLLKL